MRRRIDSLARRGATLSVLAALALTLPLDAAAWNPVAVSDDPLVRMPGSQPGDGVTLDQIGSCANCHDNYDPAVEPASHWRGSMMASAARDPLWFAAVTVAAQDSIWAIGRPNGTDLCLRCHSPEGWLEGRSDPTNGSALVDSDFDGVHCRFCHQSVDPFYATTYDGTREGSDPDYWDETDLSATPSSTAALDTFGIDSAALAYVALFSGNGFYASDQPVQSGWTEAGGGQYFIDPTDIRRASFADAEATHAMAYSRFHKSKYFCQTCHDVSNPVLANLGRDGDLPGDPTPLPSETAPAYSFFHVERTFSEFMLSAYGVQGGAAGTGPYDPAVFYTSHPGHAIATCQDCHMADSTGKGCDKNQAPLRPDDSVEHPQSGVPVHDFTGGNIWIPRILASTDPGSTNYDSVNQSLLGQGPAALTLDLTAGVGFDPAALLDGATRAEAMLLDAASVDDLSYDPDTGALTFRIYNHTGHKLISGFPEGRRMFVNIQVTAGASLLDEINPYDDTVGTLKGLPSAYSPSSPPLGLQEEYLDDLVYEMHPSSSLTGENETFHFVLADGRHKDNRIPPLGFRSDQATARLCQPVWDGSDALDYYSPEEYAGGYDQVDLSVPSGADAVTISLYYQTTSREYIEFLRDEILGVATTLGSPTPSGEAQAYVVQSDPFFTQLAAWGDTIWQLWDHNKQQPGAAPVLIAQNSWTAAPCVPTGPEVCDGIDNDCVGGIDDGLTFLDYYPDTDSDGYGDEFATPVSACAPVAGSVTDHTDCDDSATAVNPGATEVTCDTVDNDCDATTLDDPDGDGDGSGVCEDCDDGDGDRYPGNPEVCDGKDNDCANGIDDGLTFLDYYPDTDSDGYGDQFATPVSACAPVTGSVTDHTDCDDGATAVNPGATEVTCDTVDNDCDATTLDDPDNDDDGVGVCEDCDDGNPASFPGNPEICDGIDNDCLNGIDDGLASIDYWPDADSDGYGDASAAAVTACAAPPDHVTNHTDCDDNANAIHPGAVETTCDTLDNDCDPDTLDDPDGDEDGSGVCEDCDDADDARFPGNPEICDGKDNDCAGGIDDGLASSDFWPDTDGDGYGDPDGETVSACAPPAGYSDDHTDCDDTTNTTNPGAGETSCDSLDNDCDPTTVDDPDGDQDGVGVCEDCDDSDNTRFPGNPEICDDQIDNDCDGATDSADSDCAVATEDEGCGCQGSPAPDNALLWLLVLLWLARHRLRRARTR